MLHTLALRLLRLTQAKELLRRIEGVSRWYFINSIYTPRHSVMVDAPATNKQDLLIHCSQLICTSESGEDASE